MAEGLKAKNIIAVDAPVSGGVAGAEKGTLAVMVSCDDQTFATIKPIVEVIGKVFHVGKLPGQGQTMKLLNNLLSATAMAISSEALVMGVKAGLDEASDRRNQRGQRTQHGDEWINPALRFESQVRFRVCHRIAQQRHSPLHGRSRGHGRADGGGQRGPADACIATASQGPDADMTELIKVPEGWAGVVAESK